jgi:hypothetical protein
VSVARIEGEEEQKSIAINVQHVDAILDITKLTPINTQHSA